MLASHLQTRAAHLPGAQPAGLRSGPAPGGPHLPHRAGAVRAGQRAALQRLQVSVPQAALFQLTDNGVFVIGALAGTASHAHTASRCRHARLLGCIVATPGPVWLSIAAAAAPGS